MLGLRTLFDAETGFEVVAEVADGLAALEEAADTGLDVVLIDIQMPGIGGLEATRRITEDQTLTDVKVVVLTTFEHDSYVFEALRSGASGLPPQDHPAAEPPRRGPRRCGRRSPALPDGHPVRDPGVRRLRAAGTHPAPDAWRT